jgi:MbtH protein
MTIRKDRYKVVINHEEQYSILQMGQPISRGWREVGKTGSKTECLNYIEEVWTDMSARDKTRILKSLGT